MNDDWCWCVNGRLSPAGIHERNDHLTQTIPSALLLQMRSVGFQQVASPSCHTIISADDIRNAVQKLLK